MSSEFLWRSVEYEFHDDLKRFGKFHFSTHLMHVCARTVHGHCFARSVFSEIVHLRSFASPRCSRQCMPEGSEAGLCLCTVRRREMVAGAVCAALCPCTLRRRELTAGAVKAGALYVDVSWLQVLCGLVHFT